MAFLKVSIESENSDAGKKQYKNKVNAESYKEISLILKDLNNLGKPIDKAIKDYKIKKSDWDIALGIE